MDPKMMIFFILIGTIISLSHLGNENLANKNRRWRNFILVFLSSLTSAGKL
jgi:hypothetical protein